MDIITHEDIDNLSNSASSYEQQLCTNVQKIYNTNVPRTVTKKRPGKQPKIPDSHLSYPELEKREKRRLRNKLAAHRCREKKSHEMALLLRKN